MAHCANNWYMWVAGWWIVSSLLLFFTWNKVIAQIFNVKQAKVWHAFLFVASLAVLHMHKNMHHMCGQGKMFCSCPVCEHAMEKGEHKGHHHEGEMPHNMERPGGEDVDLE